MKPICILSDCNITLLVAIYNANNFPLCYDEIVAVGEYLAGQVDDDDPNIFTEADLIQMWLTMAESTSPVGM